MRGLALVIHRGFHAVGGLHFLQVKVRVVLGRVSLCVAGFLLVNRDLGRGSLVAGPGAGQGCADPSLLLGIGHHVAVRISDSDRLFVHVGLRLHLLVVLRPAQVDVKVLHLILRLVNLYVRDGVAVFKTRSAGRIQLGIAFLQLFELLQLLRSRLREHIDHRLDLLRDFHRAFSRASLLRQAVLVLFLHLLLRLVELGNLHVEWWLHRDHSWAPLVVGRALVAEPDCATLTRIVMHRVGFLAMAGVTALLVDVEVGAVRQAPALDFVAQEFAHWVLAHGVGGVLFLVGLGHPLRHALRHRGADGGMRNVLLVGLLLLRVHAPLLKGSCRLRLLQSLQHLHVLKVDLLNLLLASGEVEGARRAGHGSQQALLAPVAELARVQLGGFIGLVNAVHVQVLDPNWVRAEGVARARCVGVGRQRLLPMQLGGQRDLRSLQRLKLLGRVFAHVVA